MLLSFFRFGVLAFQAGERTSSESCPSQIGLTSALPTTRKLSDCGELEPFLWANIMMRTFTKPALQRLEIALSGLARDCQRRP